MSEHFTSRVEQQSLPSRLRISYKLEFVWGTIERELPFVIGVMADLSGYRRQPMPRLKDRKFIQIDRDNFNSIFASIAPNLRFEIRNELGCGEDRMAVDLCFKSLSDFEPRAVVDQVAPLREFLTARKRLSDLQQRAHIATEPLKLAEEARQIAIGSGVMAEEFDDASQLDRWLDARIATIDRRSSCVLDQILHAPEFQRLESTWRGLDYLVSQIGPRENVKLRVLDASKEELWKDFARAPEFDSSYLFRRIYEDEFGCFGGTPYSILVGDYHYGLQPVEDIDFLEDMAAVAAAAHAPFIAGASPSMFGLKGFADLSNACDPKSTLEDDILARWRSFREREDARYVGLVLPRMLLRVPYRGKSLDQFDFVYDEQADGPDGARCLWGNSAYALAVMAANTHALEGWCAGMGVGSSTAPLAILPQTLASILPRSEAPGSLTEIRIDEQSGRKFADLGFIPFVYKPNSDSPAFVDPCSCAAWHPQGSSSYSSVKLRFALAVALFVHCIKSILRDTRGCFRSRESREEYVNSWIRQYVAVEGSANQESGALFPLKSADIKILDFSSGHGLYPGRYMADVNLTVRLPAEVPSAELLPQAHVRLDWTDP